METLDIEKFNPTKAEIANIVTSARSLEIKGVSDTAGYKQVHETRIQLKTMRVQIQKTGKDLRADALAFQKAVIEKEKELVAMIEPTEKELAAKQDAIDQEKEKLKRTALLPARKTELAHVNVSVDDDFILLMDDTRFAEFLNQKTTEFLAEKARALEEEQERVESEKRKLQEEQQRAEQEKQRELELERARQEAEENAKREYEARIVRERQEAEDRVRREEEEKARKEADRIRREKEEQELFESQKKYQAFLKKNGYTEESKAQFIVQRNGHQVRLFKVVAEIQL